MKVADTSIPDIKVIEPNVYKDERGYFFESFNLRDFNNALGLSCVFVQDNQSYSAKGVLRGLHYQLPESAQDKLVRVTKGQVLDVAVDIRNGSPWFGKYVSVILSAANKKQLWVPKGFAHGFLTMSDEAEVQYKVTEYYDKTSERCIIWNDSTLDIDWNYEGSISVSEKDALGSRFPDADLF